MSVIRKLNNWLVLSYISYISDQSANNQCVISQNGELTNG